MAGNEELVSVTGSDGSVIAVPRSQLGTFVQRGFTPETAEARATRIGEGQRESDISGVESFGQGAGRGISLGATDVLQRLGGGDEAAQYLRTAEAAHPGLSTAGVIAGTLAPALLGDEAGLLNLTPAGFTSKIGSKIVGLGEGASAAARIGATAGAGAFEGAAQDAGGYISDVALGNRDLSVDGFLASMGRGALYGGVSGGALSVASHGLIAARKLFPIEDATAESVARAEAEARSTVKDSVDTSKALETTASNKVSQVDRETEQFITDLEQERKAALEQAAKVRTTEETALKPSPIEYRRVSDGEPVAPEPTPPAKSPAELMKAWRDKYPEGAVTLDSATAAARKQRLRDWAEGFEAKTPEDETIKAYFSEPQDPMRTGERVGNVDAPKAVQQVANKAAADAAHQAYAETTASAANVSKSGDELMARATYASRRAAARALDDVYTAYAAGQPIVDIRAAVSKKLSGQLRELSDARSEMLSALGKSSDGSAELLEKLKASVAGGPKTLGERILAGVEKPVDADEAVATALGKSKDVSADIADVAPKITRYEAAKANLTEALGEDASVQAQTHAKAYRQAEAKAEAANARNTAQTAENVHDAVTRDIPPDKLPGGNPKLGGWKQSLSKFGEVYEALHGFGLPLPGLHSIPIIGPILSTFLKAKVLGKVLRGHGGSFAATAEGTIAAKAAEVQNRVNTALNAMLERTGNAIGKVAESPVTGAAAGALGYKLFDAGPQQKPYSSAPADGEPEDLFEQRLAELSAAMQPGAVEREIRARVNTSDPTLLDQIVAAERQRLQYLYNQAPKPMESWPGQPAPAPSKQELADFSTVLGAYHDPAGIFEKVAAGGTARPAEVACVQNCYPNLYQQAISKVADMLASRKEPPSYAQLLSVSALTGMPMDRSMSSDYATFLHPPAPPVPAAPQGASAPPPKAPRAKSPVMKLGTRSLTRLDR